MTGTEIADGLHRIAFKLDGKLHGFHLVETRRGYVLFDTGVVDTPTEHVEPYLASLGSDLTDIHLVVFTHADADHMGGNPELRSQHPDVAFAAHRADVPMVESKATITRERYHQFAPHGITYPEEIQDWLDGMMGDGVEPVDIAIAGGETIPRNAGDGVDLYHAPGHTDGHLIAHDKRTDLVIGGDVVYPEGAFTTDGEPIQPPPYVDVDDYLGSIELLRALDPTGLLLTHFEPLYGDAVDDFLDRARDWVVGFDGTVRAILDVADGPMTVPDLIDEIVDRRGSFGMDLDLAFALTAHLERLVERGAAEELDRGDDPPGYRPVDDG